MEGDAGQGGVESRDQDPRNAISAPHPTMPHTMKTPPIQSESKALDAIC
jgi:hypothetical protein